MLRKLCLFSAALATFLDPQPMNAITGNNCTVAVNGAVNTPVSVFSACTTISTLINPNINFVSGTPMPPGMLITKSSSSGGSATWQVSGTPTSAGNGSAVYSFTDTGPGSVTMTVNYNILAPVVPSASFSVGTMGRPYPATSVTATGGTNSGFTFAVSSGALPNGLSLASNGSVSGTTTTAGTFNFTIQATDSSSNTGSTAFSIVVNAAVSMPPNASIARTVGQSYSGSFAATGGTAPLSYSISAGTIAPGALLNAGSGALTGTVNASSTNTFTVTATDVNGSTASTVVSYVISPAPAITLSTPSGTLGTPYSQTVGFTGALSAAALAGGALPSGLSLTGGNTIAGTPSATGTFNFTLAGTDSNGVAATASFSILITGALGITTATLPSGNYNSAYSAAIAAIGGTAPIGFSVTAGALPTGVSLSPGGALTGTASAPGTFNFTVTATDALNATVSRPFTVVVTAPALVLTTTSLPGATQGTAYAAGLSASGGAGALTFAVTNGVLPAGITLSAQGAFSGTPTSLGSFSITVAVTDAFANSVSRSLVLTVTSPPIVFSTGSLPVANIGSGYSATVLVTGGSGPLAFSLGSGALPAGLSLNPAGVIAGTPTATGASSFSITAADGFGNSNSRTFTLTVISPISILSTSPLVPATVGAGVSIVLQSTGGTAPLEWSVTSGSLAAGLQLAGGVISGVPAQAGMASFTVRVTDANGATASAAFQQMINPRLGIFNPTLGGPYSRNGQMNLLLTALGGTPPLEWSIATGQLPAGIQLNPDSGRLSGAFQGMGTFPIQVRVRDAAGAVSSRDYVLRIWDGPQFGNRDLPGATANIPYRADLEVFSSLPIVEWMIGTPHTFPPGLLLTDQGISGVPLQMGVYDFEISIRDQGGSSATRRFQLTVNPMLQLLEAKSPAEYSRGTPMNWTVPRAGGTPPFRFQLLNGVLPQGLTLNGTTGVVSGTTQSPGEFPFTIGVTDTNEATANRLYQLRSGGRFQILEESLPRALALGLDFRRRIDIEGGVAPYSLRLTEGALPPGLSLDGTSIFGRPTRNGSYPLTLTATDAAGASTSRSWTLLVTSEIESQPKSLQFLTLSGSQVGIPQTLKLIATSAGNTIRITPAAPWLRVSSIAARAPGFIEVWVDPSRLPPGISTSELALSAGTVTTRLPVKVEVMPEDPGAWWIDFTNVPNGGWAALLQANASPVPFSASIPDASAGSYRLNEVQGEILGPESYLLWLERLQPASPASGMFHLTVENSMTGEQQIVEVPDAPLPAYECSAEVVHLLAQAGASRSTQGSLILNSTAGRPVRFAAVASQPWLEVQVPTSENSTSARVQFSARTANLPVGRHTAQVDLYDLTGTRVQTVEVQLSVSSVAPPVEFSTRAVTLRPDAPGQAIRMSQSAPFPVSYSATTSSTVLRIENPAGTIPAGGEVELRLSAPVAAFQTWSRHAVVIAFGDGAIEIVEVDLAVAAPSGRCPSESPVVSFLSPGPGFAVKVDQPVAVRLAVRNGCGQSAGGAVMLVKIPGEGPVALFRGPDGIWENVWYPALPSEGLQLEANWIDPQRRRSVARTLSGSVLP